MAPKRKATTATATATVSPAAATVAAPAAAAAPEGLTRAASVSLATSHHVLQVTGGTTSIREFVKAHDLDFAKGVGYYELVKAEDVTDGKQMVVQEKKSGAFITGSKVRTVLGLPEDAKKVRVDPAKFDDVVREEFRVFVQSTSHNRNLPDGSFFLYEVEPTSAAAPKETDATTAVSGRPKRSAATKTEPPATTEAPKKRGRGAAAKKDDVDHAETAATAVSAPPAEEDDKADAKKIKTEPAAPAAPPPVADPVEVPMEGVAEAPARGPAQKVEIVFSFDTTGSMYPCLGQLRRNLRATIARLLNDIPNVRIGVIAHGDYCDGPNVISTLDFTSDVGTLVDFVERAPATGGGDADECYELVLRDVQKFSWSDDADQKALVLIGDNNPHSANMTPDNIDWRTECGKLKDKGIRVHGVQALSYKHATAFYRDISQLTGGMHCSLDQFAYISDFVMALTLGEYSPDAVAAYETELRSKSTVARSLHRLFDQLLGRSSVGISADGSFSAASLDAVLPGRFQVLHVDHDISIKDFAGANGLIFKQGKGFYEFTKPEVIQGYKEIVLMDKITGDMFSGDKARELLGIDGADPKAKVKPVALDKYRVFVQSTSYNRKLLGGTGFLYEVDIDK